MTQRLWLLQLLLCLAVAGGANAEFWDSDFVNTLYSFVRYKGYFVSLFQHATKPNYFFYTPLVLLDKDSGQAFYNYLVGMQEIDFSVVMSTDGLRAEVLQHLISSKQVQSPVVQMIPMETVKFTYASVLRRGSMKADLETTSVPNNHLPNTLPIKFYSFSETDARDFMRAVQQHPAILDQMVLEYTITQRRTAEKQVEINAQYIASTALFAKLTTVTAPGTIRYLTAQDANAIASQSYSSIQAKVVRTQEYIEGPDELKLTQIIEQLLTRDATRWSELDQAAHQSVFWDPAYARPDEVTSLLNRVYERDSGSSRLLRVSEDQQSELEKQAAKSTACYLFQCASAGTETGRRLDAKQRLSEEQMNQFLNERQLEVHYNGKLFVVKNMQLYRVNTADFQGGQTIATSSVQVTKKQEIHSLKLKTDTELPNDSEAVSQAACSNSPYSYKGCYEDNESVRDLNGFSQRSGDMQVQRCFDLCSTRGFAFFGLQDSSSCYCGANYGRYRMRPDSECDTRCSGDSAQRCGGRLRNSVFGVRQLGMTTGGTATGAAAGTPSEFVTPSIGPVNVYNSSRFDYRGCYADPNGGQQPWLTQQSDLMSVDACYSFCSRELTAWFGLRGGTECHCRRSAPRLRRLADSQCRVACAGDSGQICGGTAAVSLYALASLRQGVLVSGGGGGGGGDGGANGGGGGGGGSGNSDAFGSDWGGQFAAAASSLGINAASGNGGGNRGGGGSDGGGQGYKEVGCPGSRDAFIELSAFQTPGLAASDCVSFCRADDATVKFFRVGSDGSSGGRGGFDSGFGTGGFGGSNFGAGSSGGAGDSSCSCLYALMPESRIRFGSGTGNCGGYKYYSIDGR